jgi:hypothetical protein
MFAAPSSAGGGAIVTGARVKIRTTPNASGPGYAGELEVRRKG